MVQRDTGGPRQDRALPPDAIADLLRSFPNNPAIDSDLGALELRIEHYLKVDYNRRIHESLSGLTPEERFLGDDLPLRPIVDPEISRQHFLITDRRKVSRDNVIMVKRVPYEVPRGHAGKRIDVHRHLLDRTVAVMHEGRLVQLARVDKILNAVTRRARPAKAEVAARPVKTAAPLPLSKIINHSSATPAIFSTRSEAHGSFSFPVITVYP